MNTRRLARLFASALVLAIASGSPAADVLWDNDLESNGLDGRATSPPQYPDHRATDDFTIPDTDTGGWILERFRVASAERHGWFFGKRMEVYVYADDPATGCPDPEGLVAFVEGPYERTLVVDTFSYAWVLYAFEFEDLRLPPGTWHIGYRMPDGSGKFTTFWLTSEGGEGTERLGCWSDDAGATWMAADRDYWHHAFEIHGTVAAPCPADLDHTLIVDFADLLLLLGNWGACPPEGACPADLDGNGVVEFADLLIVLRDWGPCE